MVDDILRTSSGSGNNWTEYRRLVLHELERLDEKLTKFGDKIDRLNTSVTRLQVKSGVWGAVGGMIPITIALIFYLIRLK